MSRNKNATTHKKAPTNAFYFLFLKKCDLVWWSEWSHSTKKMWIVNNDDFKIRTSTLKIPTIDDLLSKISNLFSCQAHLRVQPHGSPDVAIVLVLDQLIFWDLQVVLIPGTSNASHSTLFILTALGQFIRCPRSHLMIKTCLEFIAALSYMHDQRFNWSKRSQWNWSEHSLNLRRIIGCSRHWSDRISSWRIHSRWNKVWSF